VTNRLPFFIHSQNQEEWEIKRILDKRVTPTGRVKYLARWLGYGPEFDTWLSVHSLAHNTELVKDYDRTYSNQPQNWIEIGLRVKLVKSREKEKEAWLPKVV
jgi:hypothetical protein